MYEQIWVEPVGDIIIARIRGEPSGDMLRDVQDRVLTLVNDTRRGRVLYDALEMNTRAARRATVGYGASAPATSRLQQTHNGCACLGLSDR